MRRHALILLATSVAATGCPEGRLSYEPMSAPDGSSSAADGVWTAPESLDLGPDGPTAAPDTGVSAPQPPPDATAADAAAIRDAAPDPAGDAEVDDAGPPPLEPDAAPTPAPPTEQPPPPEPPPEPPPPLPPLGRNDDHTTLVVWSQNIRMGLENWRNMVRCMGDRECNSLGAVPDVMLFQEASCDNVREIRSLLWRSRAEGGLDIEGWEHLCFDNPGSGGVTGHWLSNAILFRSDRFELDESRRLEVYTGGGASCGLNGRVVPVVKLLDRPRAEAGLAERRATFAVRHDDHFGPDAERNTCDHPDAPNVFCTWRNSKLIDRAVADMGGGVLVMAGDWNYAAKHCELDGRVSEAWKHDYACSTNGLWETCDGGATPNLGWRDPLLEDDPAVYDARSVIDFFHAKDTGGFVLNRTARNDRPGIVGAHFYCAGHGPYAGPAGDPEPERMSDHSARFVRVHY